MTTPISTIARQAAHAGVLRLGLIGEFDRDTGDALSTALIDAAHRPGVSRVVVDLEHTLLIDSHAIAGLVAGYQAATAAGREFAVVNGRGLVQQVLDITGLSEVLCDRT